MEVSGLVSQMHETLSTIHETIASLSTTQHDARLDELEHEREKHIQALHTAFSDESSAISQKRKAERDEIAERRRKEDEERERRRRLEDEELEAKARAEDEERDKDLREHTKEVEEKTDHLMAQVEEEAQRMLEEGRQRLKELEDKRKELNRLIDEQLQMPLPPPPTRETRRGLRKASAPMAVATESKNSEPPLVEAVQPMSNPIVKAHEDTHRDNAHEAETLPRTTYSPEPVVTTIVVPDLPAQQPPENEVERGHVEEGLSVAQTMGHDKHQLDVAEMEPLSRCNSRDPATEMAARASTEAHDDASLPAGVPGEEQPVTRQRSDSEELAWWEQQERNRLAGVTDTIEEVEEDVEEQATEDPQPVVENLHGELSVDAKEPQVLAHDVDEHEDEAHGSNEDEAHVHLSTEQQANMFDNGHQVNTVEEEVNEVHNAHPDTMSDADSHKEIGAVDSPTEAREADVVEQHRASPSIEEVNGVHNEHLGNVSDVESHKETCTVDSSAEARQDQPLEDDMPDSSDYDDTHPAEAPELVLDTEIFNKGLAEPRPSIVGQSEITSPISPTDRTLQTNSVSTPVASIEFISKMVNSELDILESSPVDVLSEGSPFDGDASFDSSHQHSQLTADTSFFGAQGHDEHVKYHEQYEHSADDGHSVSDGGHVASKPLSDELQGEEHEDISQPEDIDGDSHPVLNYGDETVAVDHAAHPEEAEKDGDVEPSSDHLEQHEAVGQDMAEGEHVAPVCDDDDAESDHFGAHKELEAIEEADQEESAVDAQAANMTEATKQLEDAALAEAALPPEHDSASDEDYEEHIADQMHAHMDQDGVHVEAEHDNLAPEQHPPQTVEVESLGSDYDHADLSEAQHAPEEVHAELRSHESQENELPEEHVAPEVAIAESSDREFHEEDLSEEHIAHQPVHDGLPAGNPQEDHLPDEHHAQAVDDKLDSHKDSLTDEQHEGHHGHEGEDWNNSTGQLQQSPINDEMAEKSPHQSHKDPYEAQNMSHDEVDGYFDHDTHPEEHHHPEEAAHDSAGHLMPMATSNTDTESQRFFTPLASAGMISPDAPVEHRNQGINVPASTNEAGHNEEVHTEAELQRTTSHPDSYPDELETETALHKTSTNGDSYEQDSNNGYESSQHELELDEAYSTTVHGQDYLFDDDGHSDDSTEHRDTTPTEEGNAHHPFAHSQESEEYAESSHVVFDQDTNHEDHHHQDNMKPQTPIAADDMLTAAPEVESPQVDRRSSADGADTTAHVEQPEEQVPVDNEPEVQQYWHEKESGYDDEYDPYRADQTPTTLTHGVQDQSEHAEPATHMSTPSKGLSASRHNPDRPQTPEQPTHSDSHPHAEMDTTPPDMVMDMSSFTPRDVTHTPWHTRNESTPLSLRSGSTLSSAPSSPVHASLLPDNHEPVIRDSWPSHSPSGAAAGSPFRGYSSVTGRPRGDSQLTDYSGGGQENGGGGKLGPSPMRLWQRREESQAQGVGQGMYDGDGYPRPRSVVDINTGSGGGNAKEDSASGIGTGNGNRNSIAVSGTGGSLFQRMRSVFEHGAASHAADPKSASPTVRSRPGSTISSGGVGGLFSRNTGSEQQQGRDSEKSGLVRPGDVAAAYDYDGTGYEYGDYQEGDGLLGGRGRVSN